PYRAGDPARAAEIIVKTVKRKNVPSHLLLGVNAVEAALRYSRSQLDEATTWRAVGRSADYAEPYPAEFPPRQPGDGLTRTIGCGLSGAVRLRHVPVSDGREDVRLHHRPGSTVASAADPLFVREGLDTRRALGRTARIPLAIGDPRQR